MVIKTSNALIAAIFTVAAGSGMAWAQETAPSDAPAEAATEAATETPAAEAPADSAAEAPAAETPADDSAQAAAAPATEGEVQPGQSYVKETFGDWTMRCVKTPDNQDPCELYQLLRDSDGGAVAEASVVPVTGQVAAIMTYVAPLETDLQHGLRLQIDANEPMGYPFMVCAQIGCISRIGVNDAELAGFKRGKAANVTLLPYGGQQDQTVKLDMSLSGFTAGMDAVTKVMQELTAADTVDAAAAPAAAE